MKPISKMKGKKDGLQKYRVLTNNKNSTCGPKQTDRIVLGPDEAKKPERKLTDSLKEALPEHSMTVQALFDEYTEVKKHEVRDAALKKTRETLNSHVLPAFTEKKLSALTLPVMQKRKTETEKKIFLLQQN